MVYAKNTGAESGRVVVPGTQGGDDGSYANQGRITRGDNDENVTYRHH